MEQLLDRLRSEFDTVIIDSPPVLAITDALLVGKHTDGMIVITRMRRTTRSGLRRSLEAVERVHAKLLGVIVNGAVDAVDKRYGYTKGYLSETRSDDELHPDGQPADRPPASPPPPPPPPAEPALAHQNGSYAAPADAPGPYAGSYVPPWAADNYSVPQYTQTYPTHPASADPMIPDQPPPAQSWEIGGGGTGEAHPQQ